jgi:general secretion pathway protein G
LLFTAICGGVSCSYVQRSRNEGSLREALFVRRQEIQQFTLDHHRSPASLSELVSSGYIRQIPIDPFTGRNDTWRIEKSDEYFKVQRGSDAISSGGTPYSSW